jgi:sugar-specific transcriptional regulator TrmB
LRSMASAQSRLTREATKRLLNELRDSGLTTYEAQAYLALIRNQDVSATQVCTEADIPDSKIYFALEELQKKGLVVVSEGVPRHYRALPPREALGKLRSIITQNYEDRVDKLNKLTVLLDPLYTRKERGDVELAYVVKGLENVLARTIELIKGANREVVTFIPELSIYDRLEPHLTNLRKRGVKARMTAPKNILKKIDRDRFAEVRETTSSCENCWITLVDEKTVITSSEWKTDRCHAILTQDPIIVRMSHEYFESPRCCISH